MKIKFKPNNVFNFPEFSLVKKIYLYGSWAYDRVMTYPGRYKDALLANKLHVLSLSFAVPAVCESFGGTAGNIAYNLAGLGVKPILLGSVGHDFAKYDKWLKQHKLSTSNFKWAATHYTSSAYIMTDRDDNQLSAFALGAGEVRCHLPKLGDLVKSMTIIAPGNTADMVKLARRCVAAKAHYIFDPGQQVPKLSAGELTACLGAALILIGNDYEISLIAKKVKISESKLLAKSFLAVRTLGAKGSEIWHNGKRTYISAVKPRKVVDPTGAGDAYRAGLIYGLIKGWSIEQVGCFASLVASYAVEKQGTQKHYLNQVELKRRFKQIFNISI